MELNEKSQVCCNTEANYFCLAPESSSLTWNVGTDITAQFLGANHLNSSIYRGDNKEYEFVLTNIQRNSSRPQFSNFFSMAYVNVTRAVNRAVLECTDGVSPEAVEIRLNSSEYS